MDITRMDRLGLPVFSSVRPRGARLRVHAGKGIRSEEAEVGALMEAIEFAVAESLDSSCDIRRLSMSDIARQLPSGIRMVDFAPRIDCVMTPESIVPAVSTQDIATAETAWIPAELIFHPFQPSEGESFYLSSTNGLASGNSIDEATLHGLLEVLERDAVAMNTPHDRSQWIDPDQFPEPFRKLAADWSRAGIFLAVRHVPNEFGLPCFEATLHEPRSDDVNLSAGNGLHLNRRIALSRAICEAAQSRLTIIHGGRDDVTDFYRRYSEMTPQSRREGEAALIGAAFDVSRRIAFDKIRQHPIRGRSVGELLDDLLARMRRAGFPSVLRHRFVRDLRTLQVVKIVVPRCEFLDTSRRVGPRLAEAIVSRA